MSTTSVPNYEAWHPWEAYYKSLPIEFEESMEEGKDLHPYEALFAEVAKLPNTKTKSDLADTLYELVEHAPIRESYPYVEPNEWEAIQALSDRTPLSSKALSKEELSKRVLGAWYGRICGCLLGKAVEGISYENITKFLQKTGNYPMHRYIVKSEADAYGVPFQGRAYEDGILDGMPVDDDTNYILFSYLCIRKYGRHFTSDDMMKLWLEVQGKNPYCTAERVAFRNFVNGFTPPDSASYKNPFREWIGAQIRGDYFGWINPGNPEAAAKMAWTDARISHIKNGIYGEMWVSSMLAYAPYEDSLENIIQKGLSYIPRTSRLHQAVSNVLKCYSEGMTQDGFFEDFHRRWDDRNQHHWCHTISNAEIVTAVLLWGKGDYTSTICRAVQEGFDTDCNAATSGSILGMFKGITAIPPEFKDKINHTLKTSLFGYERIDVDFMAEDTMNDIQL